MDLATKILAAEPRIGPIAEEDEKKPSGVPERGPTLSPEALHVQEALLVQLVQQILLNNSGLLAEFRKNDSTQTLVLPPDSFFSALERAGITVEIQERQSILDLPGVLTNGHIYDGLQIVPVGDIRLREDPVQQGPAHAGRRLEGAEPNPRRQQRPGRGHAQFGGRDQSGD